MVIAGVRASRLTQARGKECGTLFLSTFRRVHSLGSSIYDCTGAIAGPCITQQIFLLNRLKLVSTIYIVGTAGEVAEGETFGLYLQ